MAEEGNMDFEDCLIKLISSVYTICGNYYALMMHL